MPERDALTRDFSIAATSSELSHFSLQDLAKDSRWPRILRRMQTAVDDERIIALQAGRPSSVDPNNNSINNCNNNKNTNDKNNNSNNIILSRATYCMLCGARYV